MVQSSSLLFLDKPKMAIASPVLHLQACSQLIDERQHRIQGEGWNGILYDVGDLLSGW